MNEQQVRQIIREELARFMKQSKYVFDRPIQILDGNDITLASEHGTRIGTAATQKLGFFGAIPVIQQSGITSPTGAYTMGQMADTVTGIIGNLESLGLFETV